MYEVLRDIVGLLMFGGLGLCLGCSGEVNKIDGNGGAGGGSGGSGGSASCTEQPGMGGGGSGGGMDGPEVRGGFGITGNANFMHDLVKTSTVDVTWSGCTLSYTAPGPIEAGNCQVTLGMVLGGLPKPGKKYVLDAMATAPADGQGYATVVESCTDSSTYKAWRSTDGSLIINTIVGKRISMVYGDSVVVSLAPDTTLESNDAMGTMVMSGYANIDLP